jgi:hypothetical protein
MATTVIKERLKGHLDHCYGCREIYSTLSKKSAEALVPLYKKKCYEQLIDILSRECPTLLNRRMRELNQELARTEEGQALKCEQIVSHYFSQ